MYNRIGAALTYSENSQDPLMFCLLYWYRAWEAEQYTQTYLKTFSSTQFSQFRLTTKDKE